MKTVLKKMIGLVYQNLIESRELMEIKINYVLQKKRKKLKIV